MSDLTATPDFFDKIPRYAQYWIRSAQEEISSLRRRAAITEGVSFSGPSEVRAALGGYGMDKDDLVLPTRTEITFTTGPTYGEELRFRMPTTRDQGWIEVTAHQGTILSRPSASNLILLKSMPSFTRLSLERNA